MLHLNPADMELRQQLDRAPLYSCMMALPIDLLWSIHDLIIATSNSGCIIDHIWA